MKLENYQKMVELQHSFNILAMGENYLDLNLNWNSAIIDESSELLKSLGYEWWKKTEVDMDNAKVEAIDLLCFVISESTEEIGLEETYNCLQYYFSKQPHFEELSIIKLVDYLNFKNFNRIGVLRAIFKKLEMSNEDVYKAYVVKNCLNTFRQNNGYKEGTYQKIWIDKEDNVVAYELANEIGANDNLFDLLYAELEEYYNSYMKR